MSHASKPAPVAVANAIPTPGDCLLVGAARSGTSLACSLLNQRPDVVALDEPYSRTDVESIPPDRFPRWVSTELVRQRRQVERTGRATSTTVGSAIGNHYDNPQGGPRRRVAKLGEIAVTNADSTELRFVVKHTLLFAAHIAPLVAQMPVFALVRNPLAILLSWNSIDADYRLGLVPGYVRHHVPDLAQRLAGIEDRLARQVELLDWHYAQFDSLVERGTIIRFEDIVATDGANLDRIAGCQPTNADTVRQIRSQTNGPAPVEIHDANRAGRADASLVEALVDQLARSQGHYLRFYAATDIETLAGDIS